MDTLSPEMVDVRRWEVSGEETGVEPLAVETAQKLWAGDTTLLEAIQSFIHFPTPSFIHSVVSCHSGTQETNPWSTELHAQIVVGAVSHVRMWAKDKVQGVWPEQVGMKMETF